MTRIVIGGPTLTMVPASFAEDLARLYAFTKEYGPWTSVHLDFQPATYVHVGREKVLCRAIDTWNATHLLWLDTDMSFPADVALRLVTHDQPIVAANCVMRCPQPIFTAVRDGERVETGPDSTGLAVVDTVGCAVMLMRTDVVASLPRPVFVHGQNDDGSDIGEDLMFCRAVTRAGYEIYIDHDLSKDIGHVGQYTYRTPRGVEVAV